MLNSKFINIIRTFSKSEMKQFRNLVRSPLYNSNKNVIKLFEFTRKFYPGFDNPVLKKENLFGKLYPGKKYNDTVMRILLSDLLRLAEEYLMFNRSRKGPIGESLLLLEELKNRGLDNLFKIHLRDIKKRLEKVNDLRNKYFYKFELEIINVDYHVRKDRQQQISRNVLDRSENLIYFTMIEFVKNIHDLIINERTYNARFEFNLPFELLKSMDIEPLMEKIKKHRSEHYWFLSLYYNLLMALIEEDNEERYDRLKTDFISVIDKLAPLEKAGLFNDLETCCLNRMRYDINKYRLEIFEIYNLMLKWNCISASGSEFMTAQRFKNIFISAVNLNEFKWASDFTIKYINKVQPEFRDSMQYYSDAIMSFCNKDFLKALEYLTKVKNDYFTLKIDVKSWMLKIYYELGYNESAFSSIDSYRHFLSKNKTLSEHFRERHFNYLKFTRELLKLKSAGANGYTEELALAIKNTGNVVHKDWLVEKINSIK